MEQQFVPTRNDRRRSLQNKISRGQGKRVPRHGRELFPNRADPVEPSANRNSNRLRRLPQIEVPMNLLGQNLPYSRPPMNVPIESNQATSNLQQFAANPIQQPAANRPAANQPDGPQAVSNSAEISLGKLIQRKQLFRITPIVAQGSTLSRNYPMNPLSFVQTNGAATNQVNPSVILLLTVSKKKFHEERPK